MKIITTALVATALLLPAGAQAQGICSEELVRCDQQGCTRCDGSPVVTWSSSAPGVPQLAEPITAQPDHSYHLLTISNGGTVSINGPLTKAQCEFAKHRALGEPATDAEIAAADKTAKDEETHYKAGIGVTAGTAPPTIALPGDIKSAECFQ